MAWTITRTTSAGKTRHVAMYRDPSGRQRSAGTFDTRIEAKRAAAAVEASVLTGQWTDPTDGQITFATYATERWLPVIALEVEVSTLAGYRSHLRTHFVPAFGTMRMRDVTAPVVQDWVRSKVRAGRLSPHSIRKYHTMLHGLFRQAVVDRVVAANPCAQTKLPKMPSPRVRAARRTVISPEQYEAFLAHLDPRYVDLIETEIETGARWGELIALRPRALDPIACTIRIEQTIVELSKRDSPTGQRLIVKNLPKDDEVRVLAVSGSLMARLQARIAERGLGPDDLLFTRPRGSTLTRADFRKRQLQPALRAAGLTGVTMHSLRHAHASWALAGGATLVEVRDQLGHASIATTELYLHSLAGAQTGALNAIQRLRAGRTGRTVSRLHAPRSSPAA